MFALVALQALSCHSGLGEFISQDEKARAEMVAHVNVTEAVGELSWGVELRTVRHLLFNCGIDIRCPLW